MAKNHQALQRPASRGQVFALPRGRRGSAKHSVGAKKPAARKSVAVAARPSLKAAARPAAKPSAIKPPKLSTTKPSADEARRRQICGPEVGLCLRRRQGRGAHPDARPARRQGREPRRDGQPRPAGAARLHHHDRGLHVLLRARQDLSAGAQGRGGAGPRSGRHHRGRQGVRRRRQSAAGLGALRGARVDARHDGHRPQPRPQRRDRRGGGEALRRPPLRLRFLPPLHHHVRQRGARARASPVRGDPRRAQGSQRLHARYRPQRRGLGRARRSLQGVRRGGARRAVFRRTRTPSCGARSARCSARG